VGGLPWSALAVIGVIAVFRRRDPLAGVLTGAFLGGMLFFTLAEPRMGHFYGVLQPAVAGLAAIGGRAFVQKLDWTAIPAVLTFLLLLALVWEDPSMLLEVFTVKSSLYDVNVAGPVLGASVAWLLALIAARIRGREIWVVFAVLPAALLAGTLGLWLVPRLAAKNSLAAIWRAYAAERQAGEPLAYNGSPRDTLFYYSDNAAIGLDSLDEVREFVGGPGRKYLVGSQGSLDEAVNGIPGLWELRERTHPTHRLYRYSPPPPGGGG
jgi:hypothetical protein